ncbi:Hypothetical_protein [Hexamita inflata]|uniref:Hypothetical_protein n=1 Tax=Hexamita inflata TaxID=28002 RepID=A0AA86UB06_9EUKA|nr:Hypothetical protein HINF_LOCUS38265 [Hexamita inflata]
MIIVVYTFKPSDSFITVLQILDVESVTKILNQNYNYAYVSKPSERSFITESCLCFVNYKFIQYQNARHLRSAISSESEFVWIVAPYYKPDMICLNLLPLRLIQVLALGRNMLNMNTSGVLNLSRAINDQRIWLILSHSTY